MNVLVLAPSLGISITGWWISLPPHPVEADFDALGFHAFGGMVLQEFLHQIPSHPSGYWFHSLPIPTQKQMVWGQHTIRRRTQLVANRSFFYDGGCVWTCQRLSERITFYRKTCAMNQIHKTRSEGK